MKGFRYRYKTKRRLLFSLYLLAVLANQGEFFIPKLMIEEKKSENTNRDQVEVKEREFPEHLPDWEPQFRLVKPASSQTVNRQRS